MFQGHSEDPELAEPPVGLSIRGLVLTSTLVVLAGVLLTWYLSVQSGAEIAEKRSIDGRRAAATALARNLDLQLGYATELVTAGARRPGLIRFLHAGNSEQVFRVVDVIYRDTPYYAGVFVLDASGKVVASVPEAPNLSTLDPSALLSPVDLSEATPAPSSFGSENSLRVSAQVISQGQAVGILVAEISIPKVAVDIQSFRYGEQGRATLSTADGKALAWSTTNALDDIREDQRLRSSSALKSKDWVVSVDEPRVQALAELRAFKQRSVVLLSAGALLILLLGFVLVRKVSRPIENLAAVVKASAEGDTYQKAPRSRLTEIDELSVAFNDKSEQLQQYVEEVRRQNRTLEARVSERTKELLAASNKAEKAARAKGEFLAHMSHEIRSPMNGVLGMAQLLRDAPMADAERDKVEVICSSSVQLLGVLNSILDWSKLEAGKLEIKNSALDLREVIDESLGLFGANAGEKGIELSSYVEAGLPAMVVGDPLRIRQVLVNLVGNAIKFCDRGEVSVLASVQDGAITLEVRDTGTGISEQDTSRLFESFEQGDGSTSREHGGTGLGLAICKSLVELMDGGMTCKSELGGGTSFVVSLPLVKGEASVPAPPEVLEGQSALVVSESESSLRWLEQQLSLLGATVYTARTNPLQAVQNATQRGSLDMLFVDRDLCESDILSTLASIREAASPDLAICVLAHPGSEVDLEAGNSRCGALVRPLRRKPLHQWIQSLDSEEQPMDVSPSLALASVASDANAPLVLIVDDQATNRAVAAAVLKKLGYASHSVASGDEALEYLKVSQPFAVLMDCQMPGRDGFETTREIRQAERAEDHLSIVGLSAHALPEYRAAGLAAGMDDYITKPLELESLRSALASLGLGGLGLGSLGQEPPECVPLKAGKLDSLRAIDTQLWRDVVGDLCTFFADAADNLPEAVRRDDFSTIAHVAHNTRPNAVLVGSARFAELCDQFYQWAERADSSVEGPDTEAFVEFCGHVRSELLAMLDNSLA